MIHGMPRQKRRVTLCLICSAITLSGCSIQEPLQDKLLRQGQKLYDDNQWAQAEKVFGDPYFVNSGKPYRFSALMGVIRCCLREGKDVEAVTSCHQALDLCSSLYGPDEPLNGTVLIMLANAQKHLAQFGEATKSAEAALKILAKSSNIAANGRVLALITLADIRFRKRDYDGAITIYKTIEQASINNALQFRLARCYEGAGEKEKADDCFKRACAFKSTDDYPGMAGVYEAYTLFLKEGGNFDRAAAVQLEKEKWRSANDKTTKALAILGGANTDPRIERNLREAELIELCGKTLP